MERSDPTKLTSPHIFLIRMVLFLILVTFLVAVTHRQLLIAFAANPFLNGVIVLVLFIGIILALNQVARLFPEVSWANAYRAGGEMSFKDLARGPVLLAPMAALLGDRVGKMQIGPAAMRSILDSLGGRLDEDRDISRYLTGLLIFLGLLGTFWGLTETVSSIGRTISALDVKVGETGTIFESLKSGLAAPLAGMGTAFSSSLLGLAGSLILGFLDLQAGQAQNRFFQDFENWLSTQTEVSSETTAPLAVAPAMSLVDSDLQATLDRLTVAITESSQNQKSTAAMAALADGVQGLVQHMRQEQQLIRDWVEHQNAAQNQTLKRLEEVIALNKIERRS